MAEPPLGTGPARADVHRDTAYSLFSAFTTYSAVGIQACGINRERLLQL